MECNFLKRVFSLFLVAVLIFTLSGISCFAAEQQFVDLYDEKCDDYHMNINNVDQIHDIYGDIDTNDYGNIRYYVGFDEYVDFSYYIIIMD